MAQAPPERPLRRRLLWFAVLYAGGAAATIAVVYGLKALLYW